MKLFKPFHHVIFIFLVFSFSYSDPPKVALHPERLKLLEDAISWLTLRSDGKLLDPTQNNRFVRALHHEYNSTLYFRTLVIAFQLGVLPKLTLQQGQSCDPAYTLRYRSELNNSVTWHKVRNFTLQNYYDLEKSGSPSGSYCDYRQGLVCLPTTKKCDCPEGSKMGPIEPSSQVERCLLEEDEICQMPDQVTYTNIGELVRKIPELIFNLEKPQSCKHGTTCRVKDSPFTKCLSMSKAPFQNNGPPAKYGEECVLNFVGEGGGCDVRTNQHEASTCFNFWGYLQKKRLPSSSVPKITGFCALDVAPYMTPGITKHGQTTGAPTIIFFYPFLSAFVNPGTVKMVSSDELLKYDSKLHHITSSYNSDDSGTSPWDPIAHRRIQRDVGGPCLVSATEKLIEIWNFFAGLEKDPPQGQDFVADVPTLQAKLEEYNILIGSHTKYEPRICRIYWEKGRWGQEHPALTCISTGAAPDAKGNDGTCQISNNNDTYALAINVHNYANDDYKSKDEVHNGDKNYDPAILEDHPEAICIPSRSKSRSMYLNWPNENNHIHGVVLEGGSCTEGFSCTEDFSETHGIYKSPKDKEDCSFVDGYQPLYNCLQVSERDKVKYDTCEEEYLNQRVMDALKPAPRYGMGALCNHELEVELRTFYSQYDRYQTNRYRILLGLETSGICDQTKLLRCTEENICGCGGYQAPRVSADKKYISDYCYMTAGPCSRTVSEELTWLPLTAAEKKEMDDHYGIERSIGVITCNGGNVCQFIDACESECTDFNTGSSGFDVDVVGGCVNPTTTTTTTTSTEVPPIQTIAPMFATSSRRPLEPVRPFNGAELSLKKRSHLEVVVIMVIIHHIEKFDISVNWNLN